MLLFSVLALAFVAFRGRLPFALKTNLGIVLLCWTLWMILGVPFSHWKGESVNKLFNVWFKSFATFIIVVGLAYDFDDLRRIFRAFAWGAAFSVFSAMGATLNNGRLEGVGSLANANELAFHLLWGVPFVCTLISESPMIKKIILTPFVPALCYFAIKTVSRSGLIMQAVIGVLTFIRVSPANKAKLLVLGILVGVVGFASLNQDSIDRYATLFDKSAASSDVVASANLSSETRKMKMREGIILTMRYPIFGVGMGAYQFSSVDLAREIGDDPVWLEAHNSYIQVSSETGFPGLICLLVLVFYPLFVLRKFDKAAKAKGGLEHIRNYSFVLILMDVLLIIMLFFDAMGYLAYIPLMAGLVTVFINVATPLLYQEDGQRLEVPVLATAGPAPVPPPRVNPGRLQGRRPHQVRPVPESPEPATTGTSIAPNRYRMGRRRVD